MYDTPVLVKLLSWLLYFTWQFELIVKIASLLSYKNHNSYLSSSTADEETDRKDWEVVPFSRHDRGAMSGSSE